MWQKACWEFLRKYYFFFSSFLRRALFFSGGKKKSYQNIYFLFVGLEILFAFQEGLHAQRSVCESRSFRCGDVSVFRSVSVSQYNVLVFIDAPYDGWIAELAGSSWVFVKLHRARCYRVPVLTEAQKHPCQSARACSCPLYSCRFVLSLWLVCLKLLGILVNTSTEQTRLEKSRQESELCGARAWQCFPTENGYFSDTGWLLLGEGSPDFLSKDTIWEFLLKLGKDQHFNVDLGFFFRDDLEKISLLLSTNQWKSKLQLKWTFL